MLMSQCAVCRSWPGAQVCRACVARFSPACKRCMACALVLPPDLSLGLGTPVERCLACLRQAPPVDATFAALDYSYPWSELITRYKFGDRPGWAPFFAALMLQADGVRAAFDALQAGDFVLPVPLSAQRLQSRGFNQAWELASVLAKKSGTPARADARLLLRIRDTRPQTELKREARLSNVRDAFQPDPLRVPELAGRRVILVDDVMTSGASIFTAASALRAAGVLHITALVLARTPAT